MTVYNVAVFAAIIYAQIVTAFNDSEHQALKVQINDAKHAKAFSTLLNSIVNVNKERYDTLKKMTRLQQFPPYPPRNALRGGESEDSSEEDTDEDSEPEIVAYLVLPANTSSLRATHKSEGSEDAVEPNRKKPNQLKDEVEPTKSKMKSSDDGLRDSLRSCNSRKVKKCKKACKRAKNEVCSVYACKHKMKKKFDKECKRACKDVYWGQRYGDISYNSDEDW